MYRRYEGEWRAGQQEGVGTLTSADGSTYYGAWDQGRMHGEGVRTLAKASCPLLLSLSLLAFGSHELGLYRCISRQAAGTGGQRLSSCSSRFLRDL